jgi:hypothetical protein
MINVTIAREAPALSVPISVSPSEFAVRLLAYGWKSGP